MNTAGYWANVSLGFSHDLVSRVIGLQVAKNLQLVGWCTVLVILDRNNSQQLACFCRKMQYLVL